MGLSRGRARVATVQEGQKGMEERLNGVQGVVRTVEGEVGRLQARVAQHEKSFGSVEGEAGRLQKSFNSVQVGVTGLQTTVQKAQGPKIQDLVERMEEVAATVEFRGGVGKSRPTLGGTGSWDG